MNQKMLKICYIHFMGEFPSEQVHTIQVMRMCEGLRLSGHNTTLIGCRAKKIENEKNKNQSFIFSYYGIKEPFNLKLIRFPHFKKWPRPIRIVSFFVFALYAVYQAKRLHPDFIYTRDPYTAVLATMLKIKMIVEEHAPPLHRFHLWMRKQLYGSTHIIGIVFISHALKHIYEEMGLLSILQAPGIVAHDAATKSQILSIKPILQIQETKSRIRVGYVGSLLPGRGIDLILSIAQKLPQLDFWIVGGNPDQIHEHSLYAPPNVVWRGFINPGEMLDQYKEIDILLMPYQQDTSTHSGVHSSRWMSPLKMFEYMAAGVPLIASDLPVLREVLISERNCLLAPPKDMEAWLIAIKLLAEDPGMRSRLARAAHSDVAHFYNWEARAKTVIGGVRFESEHIPVNTNMKRR